MEHSTTYPWIYALAFVPAVAQAEPAPQQNPPQATEPAEPVAPEPVAPEPSPSTSPEPQEPAAPEPGTAQSPPAASDQGPKAATPEGTPSEPETSPKAEPQPETPPEKTQDDEDLEAELARELGDIQSSSGSSVAPPTTAPLSPQGSASAYGLSNKMNPAVSANVTLLAGGTTRDQESATAGGEAEESGNLTSGILLQEAELRMSAIVDPYFRADVTLAGNLDEVGFEEAYLSTLELPQVTLRAGLILANLGRHNLLHTHAFPFLTAPLPWRTLLGPEGLRAPGVSADVLLPLPFFAEINLQAFSAEWRPFVGGIPDDPNTAQNESVPDQRRDQDLTYLGHLKTLFDLSPSSTVELGGTFIGGRNGFGELTSVAGGDLTFKWRPVEAQRYVAVNWTSEYLRVDRNGAPDDRTRGGAYSGLQVQFLRRWWVQGRGALLGLPAGSAGRTFRAEGLLAFVPSEFSLLRLQYAYETGQVSPDPVHEVFLQLSATIGPHPAHAY